MEIIWYGVRIRDTAEAVYNRSLPFISRSIPRILFATDRNFTLQIVGVATRVATCSNGYILTWRCKMPKGDLVGVYELEAIENFKLAVRIPQRFKHV